jgi:colanic acid biosynthesis glycosyl transferase WcaI
MYSGNHSPCHPLDTLMGAALQLAGRPDIAFCFVGGGTEHARVGAFASQHGLSNVLCLPYQPIERLSASLASADLQAVVMGDAFVGIVHPCKIYNILLLGIPVLYVGPSEGHIPDLVPPEAHSTWFYSVRHGQVDTLVNHIRAAASNSSQRNPEQVCIAARFSTDLLVTKLVTMIETLGPQGTRIPVADVIPSTERTSA